MNTGQYGTTSDPGDRPPSEKVPHQCVILTVVFIHTLICGGIVGYFICRVVGVF